MIRPHVFASVSCLLSASACLAVPDYGTPEIQVRSNIVDGYNLPPNSSFNSGTPALGDDGVVSIRLISVGGGLAGLWLGPGDGTGSVVFQPSLDLLLSDVSLDGQGTAAFELFDFGSEGVFTWTEAGGGVLTIPLGGPFGVTTFSDPVITPAGTIGFRGNSGGSARWIVDDGGTQVSLAQVGGSPIGFLFTPDHAGGFIAGKVRIGGLSGSDPDEIRRYALDGTMTLMAVDDDGDPTSPFSGFDNSIALAADGRVAFIASLVGGGRGVFVSGGTTVTEIATTADADVSDISFFPPDLNEDGLVVFRGTDAAGLDAVFVGDGTELIRLIGEHDPVPTDLGPGRIDQHDGSVTFGGAPAINAAGDVAVSATLTPEDDNQVEWGSGVFVIPAENVPVEGDLDGDGDVDFDDLIALLAAWDGPRADLDGDGTTGFSDLLILLAGWTG